MHRNLEVPKGWSWSSDIVRMKNLDSSENEINLSGSASDGRSYVENVKVKIECEQFDDLLNGDSLLFKNATWKVLGVQ